MSAVVNALSGFGGGSGQIFIDNSDCNGSESRLENCPHIRNHDCEQTEHSEDAGVVCFSGLLRHIIIIIIMLS